MAGMKQIVSRTLRGDGRISRITGGGLFRFVALYDQLIANFGSAPEDGVSR